MPSWNLFVNKNIIIKRNMLFDNEVENQNLLVKLIKQFDQQQSSCICRKCLYKQKYIFS